MLLRRMSLSHTRVSNWQSLYKVWAPELSDCTWERETACLQNLVCVCFCRPSTVQCVSGTKYDTFLSLFSCSMISVKASRMTSAISPPSSIELWHSLIHSCRCDTPPGFIHLGLFSFVSNLKCVGRFWSQRSWEPFHHQRQCPPCYWWKYVPVFLRKNYISPRNHWFIYAINDAPSFTREEENDGVVRLPNRCCQKRTGTAGRSYHLLLCHLHPPGLSFISDLVKTFPRSAHISAHISYKSNSVWQIGFLLSLPRLPNMVEKEDFEIQGLDFMVCYISTLYLLADMLSYPSLVCVTPASFCQRTDCTTAAREPKS